MWSTGDCKLGLARTKGVPLAAAEPIRLPSLYSVLMAHVQGFGGETGGKETIGETQM